MSKVHRLRAIAGGPSPDVLRMVADVKGRFRRDDVRALAIVWVSGAGDVATGYAGEADGFLHELVSGVAHLGARLQEQAG